MTLDYNHILILILHLTSSRCELIQNMNRIFMIEFANYFYYATW